MSHTITGDVQKIYQRRFQGKKAYRNLVWQILCEEIFQAHIPKDATILDLGHGYGEFLGNIRCKKKYGMDLNPDAHTHAPEDAQIILQDCSQPWKIPAESLDLIFSSNFFEHLPDKPALERTLEQAFQALKPNGKIICMGPNIARALGKYWDFWDHHIPLTEKSIKEVLELKGFHVLCAIPTFLPYTMQGKIPLPGWAIRLYAKTPILWPIFGKQFLVTATKP